MLLNQTKCKAACNISIIPHIFKFSNMVNFVIIFLINLFIAWWLSG